MTNVIKLPTFTPDAKKRWNQIADADKKVFLDSVWCSTCKTGISMQVVSGKMKGTSLLLQGTCKTCGEEVARVIEPD